jgi:hypothetical protein
MAIEDIVSEIDAEILRLQQVRSLLTATHPAGKAKLGRPAGVKSSAKAEPKRTLSAEARAKIAAAQKLRWAKFKKATKKTATKKSAAKKTGKVLKKAPAASTVPAS